MEIPSLGGVLCAERTPEHLALYEEDVEAVFWSSAEECARKCAELLKNDQRRLSIAAKGRERFLKNEWTNMRVVRDILLAATDDTRDYLRRFHEQLPAPEAVLVK